MSLRQNAFRSFGPDMKRGAATLVLPLAAALWCAPPAGAGPDCSDLAPNTRICRTPGHSAITTSPNPAFTNPWPGWGFGGVGLPAFGLGRGGIWLGF